MIKINKQVRALSPSLLGMAVVGLILTCSVAAAQDFHRHEFSINVGGGVSSFQIQPTEGKDLWNWTGTAGLGYHLFFNQHWGIGTGANFAIYNGGISIDNYNQKQITTNLVTGEPFDFLVSSSDYREAQQAMTVTIPLMLQFQGAGTTAFYAALGGKVGIPVSSQRWSEGVFTTKGHYADVKVTYEELMGYGFVANQPFPENKTDISLKTVFMASIELGVKWRLGEIASLYTGIYVDYGLNDVLEKETVVPANPNLVVYQPTTPAQFAYNTATNSYAKQMAPFAGGITLRLSFGAPPIRPKGNFGEQEPDDFTERVTPYPSKETERMSPDDFAPHVEGIELKERRIIQQPIDNYALSQTGLVLEQKMDLDEKIVLLRQYPGVKMSIYGHTCEIGDYEINETVGFQRAEKVKEYLLSQGIAENRIVDVVSKRDTQPLVPNIDEEFRRKNRRVEILIVK